VDYNVSDNLNTESSLIALQLAVKQRKNKEISLIHHSDRGLQYCANEYQKIINQNEIQPSMTQNSDPYENAEAKRIGILKQEFYIDKYNKKLPIMKKIIKETVNINNEKRLHLSNHILTPNQMHQQKKIIMKTYKSKTASKTFFDAV
jgi:transposase InsO family protein